MLLRLLRARGFRKRAMSDVLLSSPISSSLPEDSTLFRNRLRRAKFSFLIAEPRLALFSQFPASPSPLVSAGAVPSSPSSTFPSFLSDASCVTLVSSSSLSSGITTLLSLDVVLLLRRSGPTAAAATTAAAAAAGDESVSSFMSGKPCSAAWKAILLRRERRMDARRFSASVLSSPMLPAATSLPPPPRCASSPAAAVHESIVFLHRSD